MINQIKKRINKRLEFSNRTSINIRERILKNISNEWKIPQASIMKLTSRASHKSIYGMNIRKKTASFVEEVYAIKMLLEISQRKVASCSKVDR